MQCIPPVTAKKIRVVLIGCGRISSNHIKSISAFPEELELVALCDINQSRLSSACELYLTSFRENNPLYTPPNEPKLFSSLSSFIDSFNDKRVDADLAVLATPSGLHSKHAVLLASLGIHICTEKPMATSLQQAREMISTCDDNSVHLFVVKQNRFNSTLQLVKKQMKSGRFGKLSMVAVNVFWQRPQSYYDQDKWRGTWEYDGGALMNQASHYIDLLDWLVGPLDSVSASIATLGRNIETEDTAALQMRWKSGTLGTMSVTMLTYPRNLEGSITLIGDKGVVRVGGKAVNQITHWEFSDTHPDDSIVEQASYETSSVYGFGHPLYYKNMISSLRGESNPACDGREGLKSLEIIIASYLSSQKEASVKLPFLSS